MRYYLRSGNADELHSRQQYLYDVFHLYFVRRGVIGNFILLESFPYTAENDITIIYGHNNEVRQLLCKYKETFVDNKIYCIACWFVDKDAVPPQSQLFFVKKSDGVVRLHKGDPYGFDFDISDVELSFYRKRKRDFRKTLSQEFREFSV